MIALSWVLTVLAAASALYRAVPLARQSLDHDALWYVLKKLILEGNLSRAKKLLTAIPEAPIAERIFQRWLSSIHW